MNLIQRHVSRLRRVLGTGEALDAPCRLVQTDAGYLLTVPGGAVDLTVFHQGSWPQPRAARAAGMSGKPPKRCMPRSGSGVDRSATG